MDTCLHFTCFLDSGALKTNQYMLPRNTSEDICWEQTFTVSHRWVNISACWEENIWARSRNVLLSLSLVSFSADGGEVKSCLWSESQSGISSPRRKRSAINSHSEGKISGGIICFFFYCTQRDYFLYLWRLQSCSAHVDQSKARFHAAFQLTSFKLLCFPYLQIVSVLCKARFICSYTVSDLLHSSLSLCHLIQYIYSGHAFHKVHISVVLYKCLVLLVFIIS